ncbi:MAG UNVERIFIED_CONTAM: hypothetical protein LVT10_24325 [Anaerolineae bacterium]|jgi:hypothetical protein
MRNLIIVMIAFLATVSGFVGVKGVENEQHFELRGYVDPTTTVHLPYVPRSQPIRRVQVELTRILDLRVNHRPHLANAIQATGIRWIRQFIRWDVIEPIKGGNLQWENIRHYF